MVTFEEKLHPKYGLRVRFPYKTRAFQYLEYFNIITLLHPIKFVPLDLTFADSDELNTFLYNRGIIYDEIEISYSDTSIKTEVTIVDTKQIYGVEESLGKYLLNYKYYSVNEVAEMLSFSRPTIYKLIDDQILKAARINGQVRINHLELMQYIKNKNQK